MLEIVIPATEYYDEKTNLFVRKEAVKLQLEHSLSSISEWEQKYHKPFFRDTATTRSETISYIKCMTLNSVPDDVYLNLSQSEIQKVQKYIDDSATATVIKQVGGRKNTGQFITAELVYWMMTVYNIPFECDKWHFNKLLTLIRVCDEKSKPQKKMSTKDIHKQNQALNAARRKKAHL